MLSPEDEARRAELEARREARAEERRLKEEGERKAAEAAAAAAKKPGKKGKEAAPASPVQTVRQPTPEEVAAERLLDAELAAFDNVPVSTDEDPARQREFLEFKKLMNEMSSGDATVGSILGAMVYQIGE